MATQQPNPNIPAQPVPFAYRLTNLEASLAGTGPVRIVAIGSSTTAGEGNIKPYPERLEAALNGWLATNARFKGRTVEVVKKGVSGQDAIDELARMQADVIDQQPALVIWQVGTNAVWNGWDLYAIADAIDEGLARLGRELPKTDFILMDMQYVPAIVTDDKIGLARRMEALIGIAASRASAQINVFRRFDLERRWHEFEKISFDRLVDPIDDSRLHQSDYCTERMMWALFAQIVGGI